MKLLLTSGGITNPSIRQALDDLLPRPVEESTALFVPTGMYAHPRVGPGPKVRDAVTGADGSGMADLGWQSVGLLELTALPSLVREKWVAAVEAADALLVAGGDALYLAHWMRESGLLDLAPSLADKVWVGISAGSMVMTPRIGEEFTGWPAPWGDDRALGLVDFSIFPHLAVHGGPGNTMDEAEQWVRAIDGPAYAVDDQTAFVVADGEMQVVSEGTWIRMR